MGKIDLIYEEIELRVDRIELLKSRYQWEGWNGLMAFPVISMRKIDLIYEEIELRVD